MNKKLLLSALIALPMAASQIHAGTEVSLENEMRNYPETLSASESITSQNSAALIAAQELQMRPCRLTESLVKNVTPEQRIRAIESQNSNHPQAWDLIELN